MEEFEEWPFEEHPNTNGISEERKMEARKIKAYQGIAIIKDDTEGPCITLYGKAEKRDYELEVKDGQQPDGRKILGSEWLKEPVDKDTIEELAAKFFNKIVNPHIKCD